MRFWTVGLIGSALALAGAGCGGGQSAVSKVNGTVTLDGKPLAGALVSFVPQDVKSGRLATGRTDANGHFDLTTFRTNDGAIPGQYKITVTLTAENPKTAVGKSPEKMSEQEKMQLFTRLSPKGRAAEDNTKPRSLIPDIYSNAGKTPLQEVVPTNGKVEIHLKGSAR
jgi:hypothetical protein